MSDDPLTRHSVEKAALVSQDRLASLLQRANAGNRDARGDLIGKYRPLLRLVAGRHARRLFKARYDESDVVQIACLDAFNSFPDFRGETIEEFNRWVEVILERTILRLWHKHVSQKRDIRRELPVSGLPVQALPSELSFVWTVQRAPGPLSQVIAGEQAVIVAQILQTLPGNYRQALELRFIEGLKLREIAQRMEVSVGAVAGYLRRGLEEMDQYLPSGVRSNARGGQ